MSDPVLPFDPFWTLGKVLSGAIALAYICFAYLMADDLHAVYMFLFILTPVACIWFPDSMGSYIGYAMFSIGVTRESHPGFVYALGWLVLLLPVLLSILGYFLLKP